MQILLSTMNIKNDNQLNSLIKKMRITTNYIVINQVKNTNEVKIKNRKVITVEEKGLSKSRNLALLNAKEEILLLADDDLQYENDYKKIIEESYKKYKKADIICFYIESKNDYRKIKRQKNGNIGIFKIMQIGSPQISMKLSSVKKIKFDEKYGVGSTYDRGEETIFLRDCLRHGLKIRYVNKKIATVEQSKSTWFKGFNKEYFFKQGQVFKRIYPKIHRIIALQFVIRKYNLYKSDVKFLDALKSINGKDEKS